MASRLNWSSSITLLPSSTVTVNGDPALGGDWLKR